jgi:hypothetical protein
MVDVQTVSIVVATTSVVVGVVFAILQLRGLVKTRQTDLIMRLYSRFGSEGFQRTWEEVLGREAKDLHDYEEKYGWAEWTAIGIFFEGLGVLLHRKLISIGLVDDLFSGPIKTTWEKMKDNIIEDRKEQSQPAIFEWFEYLYDEIEKREQKLQ